MTSQNTSVTGTHTVGIYFTDGYKNVTAGTQQGYVTLGTLSTKQTVAGNSNKGQTGQTTPTDSILPFYLNTKQGDNGKIYTAPVRFWFDIISQTP